MINNFMLKFNLRDNDLKYLLIIFIFSCFICGLNFNFYNDIGIPFFDVYSYLCNALYYAGINYNSVGDVSYINCSPVISFLTSLLFRLGFVSSSSILIVTGLFEVFGSLGLYILLRNRFESILSFVGCFFYVTSTIFLFNSTSGMLDIPAVAISIWILIFTILAVDKNYKYYLIAFPLAVIGVFTRPTVGFMFPLMLLYFFNKHDLILLFDRLISKNQFKLKVTSFFKSDEFKYLVLSLIVSVIIFLIVVIYNYKVFNLNFTLFSTVETTANSFSSYGVQEVYHDENYLYYVKLLPQYFILNKYCLNNINPILPFFIFIIFGLLIKLFTDIKNINDFKGNLNNNYFKTKNLVNILRFALVLLAIFAVIFYKHNYLYSEVSLFFLFMIIMSLVKRYNLQENYALTLINIAWFIFYIIFISYLFMKQPRYFMPAMIPVIYFIVYSLDFFKKLITNHCYNSERNYDAEKIINIFLLILVALFIVNALIVIHDDFNNSDSYSYNEYLKNTHNGAVKDYNYVVNYLADHDPDYKFKNITTDNPKRIYDWIFKFNTTKSIEVTKQDPKLFDSCGSEYIIINYPVKVKLENYTKIYNHGRARLYELNHK